MRGCSSLQLAPFRETAGLTLRHLAGPAVCRRLRFATVGGRRGVWYNKHKRALAAGAGPAARFGNGRRGVKRRADCAAAGLPGVRCAVGAVTGTRPRQTTEKGGHAGHAYSSHRG